MKTFKEHFNKEYPYAVWIKCIDKLYIYEYIYLPATMLNDGTYKLRYAKTNVDMSWDTYPPGDRPVRTYINILKRSEIADDIKRELTEFKTKEDFTKEWMLENI